MAVVALSGNQGAGDGIPPGCSALEVKGGLFSGTTLQTELAARDALNGGRKGVRAVQRFAGPAIMASVAYMDPGNFATNIQAGSSYGYQLLWVVLIASLVAMLFQAMCAKLVIVPGRNLSEACREQ